MSKKNLQNEKLDRIGRDLLDAVRISDEEIEKIIHAPNLFESVKSQIKNDQSRRKPKRFFPVWNWQTAAGVLATLLILIIGAAAIIFRTQNSPQIVEVIKTPITPFENPPPITEVEEVVKIQRAVFKAETPKLKNRAQKPQPVKQTQIRESEGVFYSLAFGGNWEAEELRIVRAELSRAELFALGVNLPVENETPKIKTDLLIGANGVAKAIRFVE